MSEQANYNNNDDKRDLSGKNKNATGTPRTMKKAFGVFMVCIYLGMGYLMMMNFFQWGENFTWVRWGLGVLFVVYGFWRGYRQFKGID